MNKNDLHVICAIHNSPVGGICSQSECDFYPCLFCIKCVVDEKRCVRLKNHKIITIKEYFEGFDNLKMKYYLDFIDTYKQTTKIDFGEAKKNMIKYFSNDDNSLRTLNNSLQQHLLSLLDREKEKIKEKEKCTSDLLKFHKDIIKNFQNHLKSYFDMDDHRIIWNLKTYCINIIHSYNNKNKTLSQICKEISSFLKNLKQMLNKAYNDNILKSFEKLNFFVNFINSPLNTYKSSIDKKFKHMTSSIIQEIQLYFKKIETELQQPNIKNIMNQYTSKITKPEELKKSIIKKDTSSNRQLKTNEFKKTINKKDISPILLEKNIKNPFINTVKINKNLIPNDKLNFVSKSLIINDNLLIIEELDIIVFLTNTNLNIWNFKNSQDVLTMPLEIDERVYDLKYFKDFHLLYCISSTNKLIEINLTENKELACKVNSLIISSNKYLQPSKFHIRFSKELNLDKENLIYLFLIIKDEVQIYLIKHKELKFIKQYYIDSPVKQPPTPTLKLEYFEGRFLSEKSNFVDYTSKKDASSECKTYLVTCNGFISISEVIPTVSLYYCFKPNTPNNYCNSFCLEVLKSTEEPYLYTVWENGSMYIYNIKTKCLFKSFNLFNPKCLPLYSIAFYDEKYLLLGSENWIFLLNQSSPKLPCMKWNVEGKISAIKIYLEQNNCLSFIANSTDENIYCFSQYKNIS